MIYNQGACVPRIGHRYNLGSSSGTLIGDPHGYT